MHARLGAIAARQRKLADEREVALKSRGQRGLNAVALVARHREFLDGLDAASLAKLHTAFLAHGRTRPGFIVAKELAPLLRSLGDAPRPSEIQEMIAAVDADGNAGEQAAKDEWGRRPHQQVAYQTPLRVRHGLQPSTSRSFWCWWP